MTHPGRRGILKLGLGASMLLTAPGRSVAAPALLADDPELETSVDPGAAWHTVFSGGRWCEGPCWVPRLDGLVFSDVRANRMWLLRDGAAPAVFRDPSGNANGNVLDANGRLVTCEHRGRRVVRLEADGSLTPLAERFEGGRLNSPNDAVLAADGAIWFTDPVYGITKPEEGTVAPSEQPARRIYRIDLSGRLDAAADALRQPNGIALAPDGRTLYVSETDTSRDGAAGILAFAIEADGRLGFPRVFARYDQGVPDGLAVDVDGRLYAASPDGVRVFAPDGRRLGRLALNATASNVAFGGRDGRRLYVTAGPEVHSIDVRVPGIEWRQG